MDQRSRMEWIKHINETVFRLEKLRSELLNAMVYGKVDETISILREKADALKIAYFDSSDDFLL